MKFKLNLLHGKTAYGLYLINLNLNSMMHDLYVFDIFLSV